jgi:hypothetical protein
VTLYPSSRGLTTGLLRQGSARFDLEFDFVEHRLLMRSDSGAAEQMPLHDDVLDEFAGLFAGKQSPVHLFWHSFDLALNRFSGRRASLSAGVDPVTREAYSHEVISFGFWAGSEQVPEPAFYSYTAPEREGLRDEPLSPAVARTVDTGNGSLALLRYDDLRATADPREALLGFFESAYEAGVRTSDWPGDELAAATEQPGTHGNTR